MTDINSFTFISEKLFKTVPRGTKFICNPLDRFYEEVKSPTTTRFLYDGIDLIGEYKGNNAI